MSWGSKCKFCSILSKLLLVDFGKVLSSSVKKLQQNLNASFCRDYIPQILTILL